MATILLFPYHWAADLNSSFALARKLEQRGHRTRFLSVPDTEARVRAQGFSFEPIFSSVFPPGSVARQEEQEASGRFGGSGGFFEKLRATFDEMRRGSIDRAADGAAADALLVSSWMPWVAIAARRTGRPVLLFLSTPVSAPDPVVPPFGSDLLPDGSRLFRLRVWLAWKRLFLERTVLRRSLDTGPELKRLAREFGYRPEDVDPRAETWPRLSLPELVFCPAAFDFPRESPPPSSHFVEASIDTSRRDASFPWHEIRKDRKLIYCSLGSVVTIKFRRHAEQLLQSFLDAVGRRPGDWQGVAVIGRHSDPGAFRCPSNALMVAEAPQVELLERADLFVTHGGLSGVKEAIFRGVPMVVVPFFYDQRGNAARVVYHGLGLRAFLKDLTPERLGELMDRVDRDDGYRSRALAMSRIFVDLERRAPSVAVIEGAL